MINPTRFPDASWQFDHLTVNASVHAPGIQGLAALLGVKTGYRPPFPFPGCWLYRGSDAMVHVIDQADVNGEGAVQLNHIAFRSDKSLSEAIAEVAASGFPYRALRIPDSQVVQFFVQVSDNLLVELDVRGQDGDPPIPEFHSATDQPQIIPLS